MSTRTHYGFSTPTSEIEKILGLRPGRLAATGLDVDLADFCRALSPDTLKDKAAIRRWFAAEVAAGHLTHPDHLDPRFLDALVLVAKSFFSE